MCDECWAKVPISIRNLVAETWCPDFMTNRHRHALEAAVRHLERVSRV
jgi:hypothetical protein